MSECACVSCAFCDGRGHIYISLSGQIRRYRTDDLEDTDTCPDCRGSGVIEVCDTCAEAEEMELE